ncbi:hypothetical protein I4F81_009895 [Pyropia yezoensis]|uniref:Uncharacterized protein n=1 Tax=Pyropia yezoensis TaxID=2788 RepID=A0ACC3CC17_PYRYE|nr:hypothetical protein I4F81_009895 [Neopyropia yezoensis]
MSSTLFWGAVGTLVPLMSNSLRKLPLLRRPWEHVLAFGGGVVFGNGVESATVCRPIRLSPHALGSACTAAGAARAWAPRTVDARPHP